MLSRTPNIPPFLYGTKFHSVSDTFSTHPTSSIRNMHTKSRLSSPVYVYYAHHKDPSGGWFPVWDGDKSISFPSFTLRLLSPWRRNCFHKLLPSLLPELSGVVVGLRSVSSTVRTSHSSPLAVEWTASMFYIVFFRQWCLSQLSQGMLCNAAVGLLWGVTLCVSYSPVSSLLTASAPPPQPTHYLFIIASRLWIWLPFIAYLTRFISYLWKPKMKWFFSRHFHVIVLLLPGVKATMPSLVFLCYKYALYTTIII